MLLPDVEEEPGAELAALDDADRPALLDDVEAARLASRRRHLHGRVEPASDDDVPETRSRRRAPTPRASTTSTPQQRRQSRRARIAATVANGCEQAVSREYATRSCGSSSSARGRSDRRSSRPSTRTTRSPCSTPRRRACRRSTGRFDVAVYEGDGTSRKDLAAAGVGERRPRHRVHVARRGEPRRGHVRAPRGRRGDDGDPHVEHRVRRALARGPARRRLRRLLRARDGVRDQPHHRRSGRPPDRRLRRRPGAGRRVRRRRGRLARRARRSAARRRASRATRRSPRSSAATRRSSPAATTRSATGTGSSSSARRARQRRGARCSGPEGGAVRDVVIYGAGRVGSAIARVLLAQGISVRMIEASRRAGAPRRRGAAEGARVQRDRLRPGLPRARADRPVAGRDLRDARRREEPVRGFARAGARDPVHRSRSRTRPSRSRAFDKAGIDVSHQPPRASPRRRSSASRTTRGRSRSRCSRATATRCST